MPAILDIIAGPGWLRGFLPALNRLGQSVPPLLFSRRFKIMKCKKWTLVVCALGLSFTLFGLALTWLFAKGVSRWWMPTVFLTLYSLFFIFKGTNQLAFGTVQGKLVRIVWRGRLMLIGNTAGATLAVSSAWYLMPFWLRPDGGDFHWIFGFSGLCFGLSVLLVLGLDESPDYFEGTQLSISTHLSKAWWVFRQDSNFRKIALASMTFGGSLMLFPHYQALGREHLGLTLDKLTWWVIAQNLGMGVFSLVTGLLADWHGNRLVLRVLFLGSCISPLLAVYLVLIGPPAASWYWLVFVTIGLTPIMVRVLDNYTLEISSPENHSLYLSTLSLCISIPIFFAPLLGLMVDLLGFKVIFLAVAAIIFRGWLITFSLNEPRQERPSVAYSYRRKSSVRS